MSLSHSLLPRLFVIGDSISIQYGPHLERFLAGKFHYDRKRDSGDEFAAANLDTPAGANGGDSRMVLAYLRSRREHQPIETDVLLLNCGLHDIKLGIENHRQVSPEDYAANLQAILKETRSANWQVVWVRSTPVIDEIHNSRSSIQRRAADLAIYNEIADRIMTDAKVPLINLHSFSENFLPDGFCDHVHYTEEVRALQGAFIAGSLVGLLHFQIAKRA